MRSKHDCRQLASIVPYKHRMELLHHDLTERIIGIYYEVYRELGSGFLEKICQSAMVIALRDAGLKVQEGMQYPVFFRGHLLGDFFPDVIVDGRVLLEIKSKSALHAHDQAQAINYLRVSPLEVALIMNFGPKREYLRRVLTNDRKQGLPQQAVEAVVSESQQSAKTR